MGHCLRNDRARRALASSILPADPRHRFLSPLGRRSEDGCQRAGPCAAVLPGGDVLHGGEFREEPDALECPADAERRNAVGAETAKSLIVEEDDAGRRRVHPRDDVQQGRLAGTVRTDEADNLPGANSINYRKSDGRLFMGQVFQGDGLWELDPTGVKPPRNILKNIGGLNGFDFGADGWIYGPLWLKKQVVRVNPDTGELKVVAEGFQTPAAANFDSKGNLYAPTFNPTGSAPALLFTLDPQGNLLNQVRIQKSSSAMLGLAFRPGTDGLLVIDFGAHQVLSVNPANGQSAVCITLPSGSQAGAGLNALTFDKAGNVYVSDSFQATIWRFSPQAAGSACGEATAWVTDPLLSPNNGVPGFGANVIEFNKKQDAMFVCNTAMDWIVEIPFNGGNPGTPFVLTNSINGCDGIAIDSSDNIWAAANQADEIVVVDPSGKAIAKFGDFNGVQNGQTRGLLFPASPAFSPDGQFLWVTNLELDLRTITKSQQNPNGIQTVDSQWAAEVTQHSIAKLPAVIPAPGP